MELRLYKKKKKNVNFKISRVFRKEVAVTNSTNYKLDSSLILVYFADIIEEVHRIL